MRTDRSRVNITRLLSACAAMLLGACSTVPRSLQGQFSDITPEQASRSAPAAPVRWGGTLIEVRPDTSETCFEVLGKVLGSSGRPMERDESTGRFIACKSGFFDPALYEVDREVTVTGEVVGTTTRKIGEYDYVFPQVAADTVHLWPERNDDDYRPFYPAFGFWPYRYGLIHVPLHRHSYPRAQRALPGDKPNR